MTPEERAEHIRKLVAEAPPLPDRVVEIIRNARRDAARPEREAA